MPAVSSFASPSTIAKPRSVWRSIVLPREHGSWALALEPVLLGMVAAPSWAGFGWALVATALFLIRRPQQIAAKRDARFALALLVLRGLGVIALAGIIWALALGGPQPGIPLIAALPAAGLFAWFDRRGAARETIAELAGAAFFAAFAGAMALAAGRDGSFAGALVGFALARAAMSILPIRAYLRRRKGQPASRVPSAVACAIAGLGFAAWVWRGGSWMPLAWVAAFGLIAGWLLSAHSPNWPARRLGIVQMVLGVAAMVTTGIALGLE